MNIFVLRQSKRKKGNRKKKHKDMDMACIIKSNAWTGSTAHNAQSQTIRNSSLSQYSRRRGGEGGSKKKKRLEFLKMHKIEIFEVFSYLLFIRVYSIHLHSAPTDTHCQVLLAFIPR
jgi:hypothetical protein